MENLNAEKVKKDLQKIVDNYSGSWTRFDILSNALALINSQEQRIKELTEENERLRAENEMLLNIKNLNLDKVIADTVRKVADLLWQGESEKLNISVGGKYYDKQEFISQIAKGMLEGANDS